MYRSLLLVLSSVFLLSSVLAEPAMNLDGKFIVWKQFSTPCSTTTPIDSVIVVPPKTCWDNVGIKNYFDFDESSVTQYLCFDSCDDLSDCIASKHVVNECSFVNGTYSDPFYSQFYVSEGFPKDLASGKQIAAYYEKDSCKGKVTAVVMDDTKKSCVEYTCVSVLGNNLGYFCSYDSFSSAINGKPAKPSTARKDAGISMLVIAILCGAGVVGIGLIVGAVIFIKRRQQNKQKQFHHHSRPLMDGDDEIY